MSKILPKSPIDYGIGSKLLRDLMKIALGKLEKGQRVQVGEIGLGSTTEVGRERLALRPGGGSAPGTDNAAGGSPRGDGSS